MAAPDFYSVAPDCIQHGLPPGLPYSAEIAAPFKDCLGGFFTFGPGKVYAGASGGGLSPPEGVTLPDDVGFVITDPGAGVILLTVLGIIVMVLAFVAWVWVEHRKLTDRAERLRAAGPPHVGGT